MKYTVSCPIQGKLEVPAEKWPVEIALYAEQNRMDIALKLAEFLPGKTLGEAFSGAETECSYANDTILVEFKGDCAGTYEADSEKSACEALYKEVEDAWRRTAFSVEVSIDVSEAKIEPLERLPKSFTNLSPFAKLDAVKDYARKHSPEDYQAIQAYEADIQEELRMMNSVGMIFEVGDGPERAALDRIEQNMPELLESAAKSYDTKEKKRTEASIER